MGGGVTISLHKRLAGAVMGEKANKLDGIQESHAESGVCAIRTLAPGDKADTTSEPTVTNKIADCDRFGHLFNGRSV